MQASIYNTGLLYFETISSSLLSSVDRRQYFKCPFSNALQNTIRQGVVI